MSNRLQVLVPEALDAQIRKAARRGGLSKGEWVRRAIEHSLQRSETGTPAPNPVARLAALHGPTGDIEQILTDIQEGRR